MPSYCRMTQLVMLSVHGWKKYNHTNAGPAQTSDQPDAIGGDVS